MYCVGVVIAAVSKSLEGLLDQFRVTDLFVLISVDLLKRKRTGKEYRTSKAIDCHLVSLTVAT